MEVICGGGGVREGGELAGPGDGELGGGEGDGIIAGTGCLVGAGCLIDIADTASRAGVRGAASRGELDEVEGPESRTRAGTAGCDWELEPATLLGVVGSSRQTGVGANVVAL